MFGEEANEQQRKKPRRVQVCCGPRCGVCPEHRAVYDAAVAARPPEGVAPTLCRTFAATA
jgi:hypothetical protein